jgi:hypothetical protein
MLSYLDVFLLIYLWRKVRRKANFLVLCRATRAILRRSNISCSKHNPTGTHSRRHSGSANATAGRLTAEHGCRLHLGRRRQVGTRLAAATARQGDLEMSRDEMQAPDRFVQIEQHKAQRRREDMAYSRETIDFMGMGIPVTRAVAFILARARGMDRRSAEAVSLGRRSPNIHVLLMGAQPLPFAEASRALAGSIYSGRLARCRRWN